MIALTPQQLADMWCLKFGTAWVIRDSLDKDWKEIGNILMKNNLADYDLVYTADSIFVQEIIKLKETCR